MNGDTYLMGEEKEAIARMEAQLEALTEKVGELSDEIKSKRSPNIHAWIASILSVASSVGLLLMVGIKPVEKDISILKEQLKALESKQHADDSRQTERMLRELSLIWDRTKAEIDRKP
jgi:hypothetical protein